MLPLNRQQEEKVRALHEDHPQSCSFKDQAEFFQDHIHCDLTCLPLLRVQMKDLSGGNVESLDSRSAHNHMKEGIDSKEDPSKMGSHNQGGH